MNLYFKRDKKIIFSNNINIILLLLSLYSCNSFNSSKNFKKVQVPEINSITVADSIINKYDLFEVNIQLTAEFDNPYDPDEIIVSAVFQSPSGKSTEINGFYFQDFDKEIVHNREVLKEKGNPYWKIRFTPNEEGLYTYYLKIKNYNQNNTSKTISFKCVNSGKAGFIRKSKLNNQFLQFESGQSYFPVGLNIAWVDRSKSTNEYEYYFGKLKDNGCNYSRIWLVEWNLPIEWTNNPNTAGIVYGIGKYSQDNSWKIDYILNQAKEKNIYLLITLGTYGELMQEKGDWRENKWDDNPYNIKNGGFCENPNEFWQNPEAIKYYKRKLRYFLSRWGYSPNILAIELWNEMNAPVKWLNEISAYLKQEDANEHFVTTSLGYPFEKDNSVLEDKTWKLKNIDYIQTHLYGRNQNIKNFGEAIYNSSRNYTSKYNKPYIIAEFGLDFNKDDQYYDSKGIGTHLHNSLWASVMSKSFGTSMTHWKEYIDKNKLYNEYEAISKFTSGIEWASKKWEYLQSQNLMYYDRKGNFQNYIATGYWGEIPNKIIKLQDGKASDKINVYIHAKRYSNKSYYFTPQFEVNYKSEGELILRVNEVAEEALLNIYLDDKPIWHHDFSLTNSLKDWQSSYMRTDYSTQMIVYDKDYKIFIPSGKHIIRIENEGKNWLTIKQISILEYLKKYSVMGLDCKDEAIFWVHNLENNWENVYSNRTIQPVKNVAFEITGIKNGNYNTEWWNTHTGNVFLIDKSESIDGVIKIKLPDELRSDIAFKIKRFN